MGIELERPLMSRDEFCALQDPPDEEDVRGYEYDEGRLIPVPPVNGPQSKAWSDLHTAVGHTGSPMSFSGRPRSMSGQSMAISSPLRPRLKKNSGRNCFPAWLSPVSDDPPTRGAFRAPA
jgi:hypothetical protein